MAATVQLMGFHYTEQSLLGCARQGHYLHVFGAQNESVSDFRFKWVIKREPYQYAFRDD